MRLDSKTVEHIKEAIALHAPKAQVYLFGSRLNDQGRGGDIDLLLLGNDIKPDPLLKARIQAEIQLRIGDQRIDLIITRGAGEDSRSVVHEALKTGCLL